MTFPREGLLFLQQLTDNNSREWFAAHKADYDCYVRDPALDFIVALGEKLRMISPDVRYDLRTNGAGSLMRIQRDTRFSADKSPYKTNIGITFWEGKRKKLENPCFHLDLYAGGAYMRAGYYLFPPEILGIYRGAVATTRMGDELAAVLRDFQGRYDINGSYYKRVPTGYAADHPHADLLRFNGLGASSPLIKPEVVGSPEFVEVCFAHCQTMAPLHRWLVKLVG